jgi:catechol 2,3-dioxygenase-like lactoylglutathione lyase family enzyme
MKRFHVQFSVSNVEQSVQFYSTLFGQKPTVLQGDYAKWMLEDPRINFAISHRAKVTGIEHLGLQADTPEELAELTARLRDANFAVMDETATTCCYAQSDKGWVHDPDQIAWESFYTFGSATTYSAPDAMQSESASACCTPAAPVAVALGMPSLKNKAEGNACCA